MRDGRLSEKYSLIRTYGDDAVAKAIGSGVYDANLERLVALPEAARGVVVNSAKARLKMLKALVVQISQGNEVPNLLTKHLQSPYRPVRQAAEQQLVEKIQAGDYDNVITDDAFLNQLTTDALQEAAQIRQDDLMDP